MRLMIKTWAVSHARLMRAIYILFEKILLLFFPIWRWIGLKRLDPVITRAEKNIKGLLFDCQMCGHCILDKTGMSCPMNCPKQLQNGPCGGVRGDNMCELDGTMRCVWVEAYRGLILLGPNAGCDPINPPINHLLNGKSSWLRIAFDHDPKRAMR